MNFQRMKSFFMLAAGIVVIHVALAACSGNGTAAADTGAGGSAGVTGTGGASNCDCTPRAPTMVIAACVGADGSAFATAKFPGYSAAQLLTVRAWAPPIPNMFGNNDTSYTYLPAEIGIGEGVVYAKCREVSVGITFQSMTFALP